jgi:RNA polymerase sigma-70 factor (ECF subfamily)
MSANAVGVSIHRFRQQYRDLVREEIAQTVSNPADVEEELKYLLQLLVN